MNHDNFDQRIRFLELLTIVQGKTLLLYRGLLHEALHKFDSTYEPDSLLEWFQAEIDRQVQEWIARRQTPTRMRLHDFTQCTKN